jgi:hypothetical protein
MAWFSRRGTNDPRFGEYAAAAPVVARPNGFGYALAQIIYLVTTVVEVILAFRFLFRLFGANAGNGFVHFIYSISWPLVAPFSGIFNDTNPVSGVVNNSHWEWATIIAFIVWGIVGTVLARLASAGSRATV